MFFKNLPIRLKMVLFYINMAIYTLPLLAVLIVGGINFQKEQQAIYDISIANTKSVLAMQEEFAKQSEFSGEEDMALVFSQMKLQSENTL